MPDSSPVEIDDNYFKNNFNTILDPVNEQSYQVWLRANGINSQHASDDYDMRGYWNQGGYAMTGHRGHYPDTFKKPNHPTFSNESIYHGTMSPFGEPWQGGTWGASSYQPSDFMLTHTHNLVDMARYFKKVEPGYRLVLPGAANAAP